MNLIKRKIRNLLNKLGYDIIQFRSDQVGQDPIRDMRRFLHNDHPLILDVGANEGQTVHEFHDKLPSSVIHSFEPGPSTFEKLKEQTRGYGNVHLWNYALGSSPGKKTFLENSNSQLSSFLPIVEIEWGSVKKETIVDVTTVDQFCREKDIDFIDILKSDTQGYDLEVFKGAENMIRSNRIGLIYFEIIFSNMYNNLPSFSEQYDFLRSRGYLLVSFYRFCYQKKLAKETNALFIHQTYLRNYA
jgi:FkbM family methyltransferase